MTTLLMISMVILILIVACSNNCVGPTNDEPLTDDPYADSLVIQPSCTQCHYLSPDGEHIGENELQ